MYTYNFHMYLIYISWSFIYSFTSEVYIYIHIYIYVLIYKHLCISICTSINFFCCNDCSYIGTCVYVKNAYILHCVICDM